MARRNREPHGISHATCSSKLRGVNALTASNASYTAAVGPTTSRTRTQPGKGCKTPRSSATRHRDARKIVLAIIPNTRKNSSRRICASTGGLHALPNVRAPLLASAWQKREWLLAAQADSSSRSARWPQGSSGSVRRAIVLAPVKGKQAATRPLTAAARAGVREGSGRGASVLFSTCLWRVELGAEAGGRARARAALCCPRCLSFGRLSAQRLWSRSSNSLDGCTPSALASWRKARTPTLRSPRSMPPM